ncbi:thioredoxin family protein [Algoriphagus sp. NG3]|uniref:thioredoxin family protein n=1 Tax=Algoriphagus sp. NG3 TaxID=3097546 RepID=UPI002A7F4D64|nr:thioredoxin fold domain-containing protein [Algoriphagus sp. NG3]WPR76884.1 thioredoxin fold domain-containing protein [Algoriphagus sp. NG3]
MKKIVIIGLILVIAQFAQAQEKIEWLKFEEAVAASEASPKMLLVDVYTDWCGWCKKMDKETFTDPAVIKYINDQFYAVKMNAENNKRKFNFKGKEYTEAKMAATMRVQSYPNFVIIDPTLRNITQLPGYRQPAQFLEGLDQLVKNGIGAK